jgi:tRNA splicing ligase
MMNDNDNTQNINTEEVTMVDSRDFEVLKLWTREELFEKVKFLYNPKEELKLGNDYFKLFITQCKHKLSGLKGQEGPQHFNYRKLYVQMLWTNGNKSPKSIVANGLHTRRSSIYTAMYNKFIGTVILVE